MKIEWSKDLETGIEQIDEEHKNLINALNELDDVDSQDLETMKRVFQELVDYTEYHFSNEECLMEKYNFSGIHKHCEFHKHFKEEIIKYRDLALKNNITFSKSTQKFLMNWLSEHIKGIDINMSQELKENGAS